MQARNLDLDVELERRNVDGETWAFKFRDDQDMRSVLLQSVDDCRGLPNKVCRIAILGTDALSGAQFMARLATSSSSAEDYKVTDTAKSLLIMSSRCAVEGKHIMYVFSHTLQRTLAIWKDKRVDFVYILKSVSVDLLPFIKAVCGSKRERARAVLYILEDTDDLRTVQ